MKVIEAKSSDKRLHLTRLKLLLYQPLKTDIIDHVVNQINLILDHPTSFEELREIVELVATRPDGNVMYIVSYEPAIKLYFWQERENRVAGLKLKGDETPTIKLKEQVTTF